MKLILTILLAFTAFFATAQTEANYVLYSANGKVYLEAKILLDDVQEIVQNQQYCESGTALSFCLRNYISDKIVIIADDGMPLDFVIEASLANSSKLQINLSSEQEVPNVSEWNITNNAFVDEVPQFQNKMKVKVNGVPTILVLDLENRDATVN